MLRVESLKDLVGLASKDVLKLNNIDTASSAPSIKPRISQTRESHLEKRFRLLWASLDLPPLIAEHRFHAKRRWRFDFAHLDTSVAVEIEGIAYRGKSRHRTVTGFEGDLEKYFEAAQMGWLVYRLGPKMIDREHLATIAATINRRLR